MLIKMLVCVSLQVFLQGSSYLCDSRRLAPLKMAAVRSYPLGAAALEYEATMFDERCQLIRQILAEVNLTSKEKCEAFFVLVETWHEMDYLRFVIEDKGRWPQRFCTVSGYIWDLEEIARMMAQWERLNQRAYNYTGQSDLELIEGTCSYLSQCLQRPCMGGHGDRYAGSRHISG